MLVTVESVGIYPPSDIVGHALNTLKQKALSYKIEWKNDTGYWK